MPDPSVSGQSLANNECSSRSRNAVLSLFSRSVSLLIHPFERSFEAIYVSVRAGYSTKGRNGLSEYGIRAEGSHASPKGRLLIVREPVLYPDLHWSQLYHLLYSLFSPALKPGSKLTISYDHQSSTKAQVPSAVWEGRCENRRRDPLRRQDLVGARFVSNTSEYYVATPTESNLPCSSVFTA